MFFVLMLYLVLVIVRPQDYPQMVDVAIPFLPITLLLALAIWLFSGKKSFAAPQYPLLLLFMLAQMLSEIANGWVGGAIERLTIFGPIVVAFVLYAQAIDSRARVQSIMVVYALCTLVLAVHGIDQKQSGIGWTGTTLIQEDGRIQYVGIFNDPNDLGLLFIMVLPMILYLSRRGGWMGLKRLFWWAAAGTVVYAIVLTNSRGTLLALVVLVGVHYWRKRGIMVAGLLGTLCLVAMMAMPSRLQELDVDEDSAMGRVEAWYEGLQMFQGDPVFGVGAGLFADFNANLTAHNSFVLVLAETGFFGFTIWLGFVTYCFSMVLAILRHQPDIPDAETARAWEAERDIAATLLLSLSGFIAAAFFLSRSYVIMLYLLAALVVGHYLSVRERFPTLPNFRLSNDVLSLSGRALLGIVLLYIVVKLLLLSV